MTKQTAFRALFLIPALVILVGLGGACAMAENVANATIQLDNATTYQTITGWEVTTQSGELLEPGTATHQSNANPAFAIYSSTVFDTLVNQMGINRVRLEIGEGAENTTDYFTQFVTGQIPFEDKLSQKHPVNDDGDPFSVDAFIKAHPSSANIPGYFFSDVDYRMDKIVLPIRQRVQAQGETLFLNVCYVAFTNNTFMQYTNAEEYAEFVLATYQHLKLKYGIVPDAWEVILEPDNTQFNGTRIGQAVAAAAARLRKFGFTPHFILPSVTDMNNVFPYYNAAKTVLGNNGVGRDVVELSYHRYGVNDSLLPTIAAEAKAQGINTSMLEHIGSGYQDLHKDLTQGNNSAWQQFVITWGACPADDSGFTLINTDTCDVNHPVVAPSAAGKYLRQYFRHVRRGAVRIQATSANGNFAPTAFINKDGTYAVIVKAGAGGTFSVGDLPAGTYGIKYTTAQANGTSLADVVLSAGQNLSTSIPAAGVITIYGKTGGASGTPTPPPSSCTARPGKPKLLTPPNLGIVTNMNPVLEWQSAKCAKTYKLTVRQKTNVGPVAVRAAKLVKTEYQAALQSGRKFAWQVKACNEFGCTTSSWSTFKVNTTS